MIYSQGIHFEYNNCKKVLKKNETKNQTLLNLKANYFDFIFKTEITRLEKHNALLRFYLEILLQGFMKVTNILSDFPYSSCSLMTLGRGFCIYWISPHIPIKAEDRAGSFQET